MNRPAFIGPAWAMAFLALSLTRALPCGPWFPNNMLSGGDETLLEAPISDFQIELNRIRAPAERFASALATNGLPNQTYEAELADLQAALGKSDLAPAEQERLLTEFQSVRQILRQDSEALANSPDQRPAFTTLRVPAGLPLEFADYLSGSIAFHLGDTNGARVAWERLLSRPKSERHYRSTWAAFMLGKSWLGDDPSKAAAYLEQTRALAQAGFGDSLGLAASSYGWQAKVELHQGHFAAALRWYLVQDRTGDPTALQSLRLTARSIVGLAPDQLASLAADPTVQQVVTAYIVSQHSLADVASHEETTGLIQRWLDAVEQAGGAEVPCADRLALAAYQRGLFEVTERWLQHARSNSAMAQWLRVKLLLRAGKVEPAAQLLAQVVRVMERDREWPDPPLKGLVSEQPGSGLHWAHGSGGSRIHWDTDSLLRQAMGELGVLRLARRDYYEALDVLLRAGFWSDAAYVAEYVLTPDEVMAYTDRQWPVAEEGNDTGGAASRETFEFEGMVQPASIGTELRYLVARRLARLQRWNEAFDFYPPKWKEPFAKFVQVLQRGRDQSLPAADRAKALWEAAQTARHDGMELFGTEVEPDWHLFDGEYEWDGISYFRSVIPDESGAVPLPKSWRGWVRDGLVPMRLGSASPDEQRRLAEQKTRPDLRFHYRYYAANLAWEASQLMPDGTDETARVLWRAGSWLKTRDPKAADRFYKALVRRCRHTALGEAADRLRWFPKTDDPQALKPPVAAPAAEPSAVPVPQPENTEQAAPAEPANQAPDPPQK